MNTGLTQTQLNTIRTIVYSYLDPKKYQAFIFGSRAIGNNSKYSDIDLGIEGEEDIPLHLLAKIEYDLENTNIPYIIDIVDMKDTSKEFSKIAKKHIIKL